MSRIEEKEICQLVLGVDGVKGCHKIRTRGSMGDVRVDMHLLFNLICLLETPTSSLTGSAKS